MTGLEARLLPPYPPTLNPFPLSLLSLLNSYHGFVTLPLEAGFNETQHKNGQKITLYTRTPSLLKPIGHSKDAICYMFRVIDVVNTSPLARNGQVCSLRTDWCKNRQPVDSNKKDIISFHDNWRLRGTRRVVVSVIQPLNILYRDGAVVLCYK